MPGFRHMVSRITRIFPWRRLLVNFLTQGDMPMTMCRLNLIKGQGPVLQIAEGWAVNINEEIFDIINRRTDKTWPTTWFAPRLTGTGAFRDVIR